MYKTPPADDEQPADLPPPTTYPRQRRRHAVRPRPSQNHLGYRRDETPEIPLVRRASLFLDQQPVSAKEEVVDESEQETSSQRPSQKMAVVQRRPTPISEPLVAVPAHRSRPPAQLRRRGRNPVVFITWLFLLAGLIIGPIVFYAVRSQTKTGLSSNNLPANKPITSTQPSANYHELIITPQDSDHPAPPVFAKAAYLLDADTGATLYAYNPFMHLPVLSTTKLMTAILAASQGNPDQQITITPAIDHDVSQLSGDSALLGLKKGETYTLRDLLYGLLLVSGNDAAVAIADTLGGNLPNFVAEMNQRAQQLGLYDTHYMNPHGLLESGQYSSAHDLALLGKYSLSLPLIHEISGAQQYHILKTASHAEHFLVNGNQFFWWYPGVDGGKTGWDGQTNFIQVVSCTRNHHHLIGVVINTVDWWTDMRDLMNWGFASFPWVSPYNVDFQHPIPYDFLWNYFTGDKKENTVPAADRGRYYVYTGYSVAGLVLSYFDSGGGLKKFGYPESMETVSSSLTVSQKFDHGTIQCDLTTKTCSAS